MKKLFLVILLASLQSYAAKYEVDKAHSNVGFKITHMGLSTVNGNFNDFTSTFEFDSKTGKLENVEAKIDIASVNTNDHDRDKHLKSDDFFGVVGKDGKEVEAKKYMTFKSTKVDVTNGKPTKVHGKLTMNGVTKDVTLDVTLKGELKDHSKLGFEATTELNRQDYGVKYNKKLPGGDMAIGDNVKIIIDGEAKKL
jgi:polyisoprenoid-binding protein YceI